MTAKTRWPNAAKQFGRRMPRASRMSKKQPPSLGTRAQLARRGWSALCPNQGRRLVVGIDLRQYQQLGEPAVANRKAPSMARLVGRLWRGLWRAGLSWRGAWQSRCRPLLGLDPIRRRPDVCTRRVVDRGSAQNPVARRYAQQPWLSPGGDARAAAVQFPQSRRQSRQ